VLIKGKPAESGMADRTEISEELVNERPLIFVPNRERVGVFRALYQIKMCSVSAGLVISNASRWQGRIGFREPLSVQSKGHTSAGQLNKAGKIKMSGWQFRNEFARADVCA